MPLDPVIDRLFASMVASGRPALSASSPGAARALTAASRPALGAGPALHEVRDVTVPTRSGSIVARLYRPAAQVAGLGVYLHGGGWVVGELDDYDAMARTLAARSRCALLLPAYRLAPEYPFPAGLEDTEDAIAWAAGRIEELAGASVPFLVGGDSAGANLAAVALHSLAGRLPVAGQLLIYPVTDADFTRDSYRNCSQGMQLTREDMQWFFSHYAPASLHADPRISPLRQEVRASLPPTVVFTAECDVLRDEGEAYADRLVAAGVTVTASHIKGLPHGFIRLHNLAPAADLALTTIAAALAKLARNASGGEE
ncbi:MAG: alpha/beta hydrolase [Burkholderiales bacterium]|nr:alpha/beta hydrolase [Burkholderiales bacterium]